MNPTPPSSSPLLPPSSPVTSSLLNPSATPVTTVARPRGQLSRLSAVVLDPLHEAMLEASARTSAGPAALRHRFLAEARDLLALAQVSGRLLVHWIDLTVGLRAKLEMVVPVPCRPDPMGKVVIAPRALLGVMCSPESLTLPQPGYAFVRILEPRPVWHGNVSPDVNQALCLGPSIGPAFPLREILLITYGALSMQTTQLDRFDAAGLMHAAGADWWQQNTHLIPLTREPFIRPEAPHVL